MQTSAVLVATAILSTENLAWPRVLEGISLDSRFIHPAFQTMRLTGRLFATSLAMSYELLQRQQTKVRERFSKRNVLKGVPAV